MARVASLELGPLASSDSEDSEAEMPEFYGYPDVLCCCTVLVAAALALVFTAVDDAGDNPCGSRGNTEFALLVMPGLYMLGACCAIALRPAVDTQHHRDCSTNHFVLLFIATLFIICGAGAWWFGRNECDVLRAVLYQVGIIYGIIGLLLFTYCCGNATATICCSTLTDDY